MNFPIPFANIGRQKRLFTPPSDEFDNVNTSTPEADKLSSYLQNVPDRENYKLGTKDKILNALISGMAGFTGGPKLAMQTAESNKDQPYNEAISDWKLKGAGLERSAEIEGQRINTRMHSAAYRNKYNFDVANLQEKKDESENRLQNEALDRQNAFGMNDARVREMDKFHAGELAARQARTNAIRERTRMMGNKSTGSQVSKPHNIANESHAMTSALADVLAQSPQAKGLFEDDGAGGHIPVPKTNVIANPQEPNPAKRITRPLNRNELTAQQKIMQHVRERAQSFLAQGLTSQGEAPGVMVDDFTNDDDSEQ